MPEKSSPSRQNLRVLILAGSNRRQFNAPGVDSKARALALRMRALLPADWEVDWEDLGNVYDSAKIQSCNSCASTAMALCCWPCNCYEKKDRQQPDLMWDLDLYARLELADAWAIVSPVNWYGPTSNLKLLFDRLICANGGNPREDLIEHKNPEKAMQLEHTEEWASLSQNHLAGRTAAFFIYDNLKRESLASEDVAPFFDMRQAYAPLVWQCRASEVEVPDALWRYEEIGVGLKASENQAEHLLLQPEVLKRFDTWIELFVEKVRTKGKAPVPKFSAVGYEAPIHGWEDLKLKWREVRMRAGKAPRGSSPRLQHDLKLNQDLLKRKR